LVETWGVSWRIYLLLKKTIGIIPENYQNFGFKKKLCMNAGSGRVSEIYVKKV